MTLFLRSNNLFAKTIICWIFTPIPVWATPLGKSLPTIRIVMVCCTVFGLIQALLYRKHVVLYYILWPGLDEGGPRIVWFMRACGHGNKIIHSLPFAQ